MKMKFTSSEKSNIFNIAREYYVYIIKEIKGKGEEYSKNYK
jgi:hypothetical protein